MLEETKKCDIGFGENTRLVGYLDVMGISSAILNNCTPEKENAFFILNEMFYSYTLRIKNSRVDDERYRFKASVLSDSLVITSPKISDLKDLESHLNSMMNYLSTHQREILSAGFLSRGSICIGEMIHENNFLFGESLCKAVNIEKNILSGSNVCAVIVDKEILQKFPERTYNYSRYFYYEELNNDIIPQANRVLRGLKIFKEIINIKDNEEYYILDYLNDFHLHEIWFENVCRVLNTKTNDKKLHYKIREKWIWTANLFNSNLGHINFVLENFNKSGRSESLVGHRINKVKPIKF